jgi:hypothetical protein
MALDSVRVERIKPPFDKPAKQIGLWMRASVHTVTHRSRSPLVSRVDETRPIYEESVQTPKSFHGLHENVEQSFRTLAQPF